MKDSRARELYGAESVRGGPGLDRRLRALGVTPGSYRKRKEALRKGDVVGDIPTPRPSPTSPYLNVPSAGKIAR